MATVERGWATGKRHAPDDTPIVAGASRPRAQFAPLARRERDAPSTFLDATFMKTNLPIDELHNVNLLPLAARVFASAALPKQTNNLQEILI